MKHMWLNTSATEVIQDMQNNQDFEEGHVSDMDDKHQSRSPSRKPKRFRSAFTTDQVNYLEKEFRKFPYIGNGQRKEVAAALNIPERAVKIWFQNRRMKEKKDANSKELTDEQTGCNAMEFVEDQLNNVSTVQLANEVSYSLPILTSAVNTTSTTNTDSNTKNNGRCRKVSKHASSANYYEETSCNQSREITLSTSSVGNDSKSTSIKNRRSPLDKSSAEFSITLCKKYKRVGDSSERLRKENVQTKSRDDKKGAVPSKYDYQDMPEDLSLKKPNVSQQKLSNPIRDTQRISLGPNYYSQPYIPSGGVVWKPINVMPIMSAASPTVTISSHNYGNMPLVQQHMHNNNCNCDCHMKTYPIPINLQQNSLNPQYIITAVPFQSPSSKK